jgi:alpha-1,3-rhamnosyl/mannosyltransferase
VERLQVDPGKITVVHPGVDAAFRPLPSAEIEAFRARLGLPRRFFLYVGLRRPHKNLERLVRAFDRARHRSGPEVLGSLVLWGAPDPRDAPTDAAVRELGLEREVRRLHQPLADGEMPLLYNACQGFVMPSLYEGFGLPPLEALGCGVPVLSSTGGSLPEVLGDAALYADPLDVEAWAAGLERLVADETLRADLGRRGPLRAAGFAWESTVRATLGVYEAVAGGASAPGAGRRLGVDPRRPLGLSSPGRTELKG